MSNEYTREWWKERLPLIQAFAEGKCVQNVSMNGKEWITMTTLHFQASVDSYRIAPEPKLRPWKPEEVPVGAWLKHSGNPTNWRGIIIASKGTAILVPSEANIMWEDVDDIGCYLHSTDGGKTWHPCGVMEEQP